MLKIGLIGAGTIADLHLDAFSQCGQADITVICDINEERAKAKAQQYGIQAARSDYRHLLDDQEIDAVIVCTHNALHFEVALAALQAGKHVFIEKPACTTAAEARALHAASCDYGKQVQVGFVRRFDPRTIFLKELIENGEFGDIYYVKASAIRRMGNPGGWFADKQKSGGGPLIDIGIHLIDLAMHLMGSPHVTSVRGTAYSHLGARNHVEHLSRYQAADQSTTGHPVEDLAAASIRFGSGASMLLDASYSLHAKEDKTTFAVFADRGGATLEPDFTLVSERSNTILNSEPQMERSGLDLRMAFSIQAKFFADACLNNRKPLHSIEDSMQLMKMVEAVYHSAETGVEITL